MTKVTGKNIKPSETSSSFGALQQAGNKKNVDIFLFFLLLGFGIFHAVIYWGHQVVPHFDFVCFSELGRKILSLQLPDDYKRLPLVGILQVLLGFFTGGQYPDFHGGWLLNSIAHSLTVVLLWLTGRKVIGRAAVWFAIIAIINPWGLQQLTESIAETTLLFFIWATFYLIFIRSKWAYLLASLATMVRYEGAALIVCAFVMDMIDSRDKKQRLAALAYALLATVPLVLWMLGTASTWKTAGPTHYLKMFTEEYASQFAPGVREKSGFAMHAKILWEVGFCHLFVPFTSKVNVLTVPVFTANKIVVFVSFLFGSVYGLYKRQWKILVLLLFFLPYFWIHAKYPYSLYRYHATVFAIVMLICIYGLCSFWGLIKGRLPGTAIFLTQVVVLMIAVAWSLILIGYLPNLKSVSRASFSLPYVAGLVVFIAFAAERFISKTVRIRDVVILTLVILIIVSSQSLLVVILGNGERDLEFKYLADWYRQNAKQGEKLVTTVPVILQVIAPEYGDCFIHTNTFDANSPEDFVVECYRRNITYVAWDSRIGRAPTNNYYKYWKVANIAPLAIGEDIGPYQFIIQLGVDETRYINLYRLRYPPPWAK